MTVLVVPTEAEEQWREERRTRVTATDISRIFVGGPAAWAAVRAEKHGATTWPGNIYTRWGHTREPVLAEHAAFLYDVAPNRSLFVNGSRAATPDGIGEGRNGEYKTTVVDWQLTPDESLPAAIPARYVAQVDWAMLVREVDECAFLWEPHENFVPGPIRDVLIHRDETRLEALIEVEGRFLEYLAEEYNPGEFDDLIALAAEKKRELDLATAALDDVKTLIRERIGDRISLSAQSPFGSISYYVPKPAERFQEAQFKSDHPDIHKKYVSPVTPQKQPTLRVTIKDPS